jgi:hypothetical protein
VSKAAKAKREERRHARRTMGNLHLKSEDALTAGTLIDGARMYAASADAVNARLPGCVFPISHLLCTSIELTLKAFLRHHGASEDDLMDLGHDLSALYKRATALGLLDTGSREYVLAAIRTNHSERLFVYPEQGVGYTIAPWRLRAMCHELVVEAFAAIKGPDTAAAFSGEPGLCIQGPYPEQMPEVIGGWTGRSAQSLVLPGVIRRFT